MSATNNGGPRLVTDEVLIELLAVVNLAGNLFAYEEGENEEDAGELGAYAEAYGHKYEELRDAVYGRPQGEGDDEWSTDPTVVAIETRANELEAEWMQKAIDHRSEVVRYSERSQAYEKRIEILRAYVPRCRERGTIDVRFQLEEEEMAS